MKELYVRLLGKGRAREKEREYGFGEWVGWSGDEGLGSSPAKI